MSTIPRPSKNLHVQTDNSSEVADTKARNTRTETGKGIARSTKDTFEHAESDPSADQTIKGHFDAAARDGLKDKEVFAGMSKRLQEHEHALIDVRAGKTEQQTEAQCSADAKPDPGWLQGVPDLVNAGFALRDVRKPGEELRFRKDTAPQQEVVTVAPQQELVTVAPQEVRVTGTTQEDHENRTEGEPGNDDAPRKTGRRS